MNVGIDRQTRDTRDKAAGRERTRGNRTIGENVVNERLRTSSSSREELPLQVIAICDPVTQTAAAESGRTCKTSVSVSEPPRDNIPADRRIQSSTVASTTPSRSRTYHPARQKSENMVGHDVSKTGEPVTEDKSVEVGVCKQ